MPVAVTLRSIGTGEDVTVWAGSGNGASSSVLLPLSAGDPPGAYNVTVTELLSGTAATTVITVPAAAATATGQQPLAAAAALRSRRQQPLVLRVGGTNVTVFDAPAVSAFASGAARNGPSGGRANIALTPLQAANPTLAAAAQALASFLSGPGARVGVRASTAAPGNATYPDGIVEALQPYSALTMRYPQWRTVPGDAVLVGAAVAPAGSADAAAMANALLFDLARSHVLPARISGVQEGTAYVAVVKSAFLGDAWLLVCAANSVADAVAALEAVELVHEQDVRFSYY